MGLKMLVSSWVRCPGLWASASPREGRCGKGGKANVEVSKTGFGLVLGENKGRDCAARLGICLKSS